MRVVPTHLGDLAVHDTGPAGHVDGPAPVLVLWPSILADHRIYGAQVAALRQRWRMILIDGPGHGASGGPSHTFSMADCALAQAQVLDALDIGQPVVSMGTSWGGLVAGEFALRHASRTRAIVMLNTPIFRSSAPWRDRFVAWGARWLNGTDLYVKGVAEAYFLPETREREREFMARFREQIQHADAAALATAVRSVLLERDDLAARLQAIAVPTLFIAGTRDPLCPVAEQREAAARLPRGRFVALTSAHVAVVDAPAESTLAIDRFLGSL